MSQIDSAERIPVWDPHETQTHAPAHAWISPIRSRDVSVKRHNESVYLEGLGIRRYSAEDIYFLGGSSFGIEKIREIFRSVHVETDEISQEIINLLGELKREVDELLESAGYENWDGDDALPVTQDLVDIAHEVIDKLPFESILKPDIEATPHGEIDFDWVIDRNTMLTISVGPGGVIAFAGTCTEGNIRGQKEWAGKLPHFIDCWFECIEGE